jgi:hypothetical protein
MPIKILHYTNIKITLTPATIQDFLVTGVRLILLDDLLATTLTELKTELWEECSKFKIVWCETSTQFSISSEEERSKFKIVWLEASA